MALLPDALRERLPPLHSQVHAADPVAHAKFVAPWNGWTWYLFEYDPDRNEAFAYVIGQESELGYVNLDELDRVKGPAGLVVELDSLFTSAPLSVIKTLHPNGPRRMTRLELGERLRRWITFIEGEEVKPPVRVPLGQKPTLVQADEIFTSVRREFDRHHQTFRWMERMGPRDQCVCPAHNHSNDPHGIGFALEELVEQIASMSEGLSQVADGLGCTSETLRRHLYEAAPRWKTLAEVEVGLAHIADAMNELEPLLPDPFTVLEERLSEERAQ